MIRFYFFIFSLLLISCSNRTIDSKAQRICNCYEQIHNESVKVTDSIELQQKVEACNNLFIEALDSFGKNEEKKREFLTDFRTCQDN